MQVSLDKSEMALTNADKDFIKREIREAVHGTGWRKIGILARNWSLPSVAGALVIFLWVQWSTYVEFRTHTSDRLDTIELTLRTIRASQSPTAVLNELSNLDQALFAKSLPVLQEIEKQPFSKVSPTPETLRTVSKKLLQTNEQTPYYWPSVLQFISFASSGMSSNVPPSGSQRMTLTNVGLPPGSKFLGVTVELDGGTVTNSEFKNSRVIFTEHPVILQNVTFIDCVFELPTLTHPNPYLKWAGTTLLASNFSSATITTPMSVLRSP